MKDLADIGIVGLASIGVNLALNIESKGYTVALYNRTKEKLDEFMEYSGKGKRIYPTGSIPEFFGFLKRPRRVLLSVKAGVPVDEMIGRLLPHLEPGDVLIDGANSHFSDTERRYEKLKSSGVHYIGLGVSGGEEGALFGPALMAGGDFDGWKKIENLFLEISAKVGPGKKPCCAWFGKGGAGHFIKMVHNGIECADIELTGEVYAFMRGILMMSPREMGDVFESWSRSSDSGSYLVTIAAQILKNKEAATGKYLVEVLLNRRGRRNTGKWIGDSAFELGIAVPAIEDAMFARSISDQKEERLSAFARLPGVRAERGDRTRYLAKLRNALYISRLCVYAQGFSLLKAASVEYGWNLDLAKIASIWQGGCIIRTSLLEDIVSAFSSHSDMDNLLLCPQFRDALASANYDWREITAKAICSGLPVPAMSGALAYYDSCRSGNIATNIIQRLQDYFGGYMFEHTNESRGKVFHANWYQSSTDISSTDFNV